MTSPIIGFLGAGHLTSAILQGLLSEGSTITRKQLLASCRSEQRANTIRQTFQIDCRTDNHWLVEKADYLVLAVKPQQLEQALLSLENATLNARAIITLAAGWNSDNYHALLGNDIPLIRAMPNLAASVQASMTGLYSTHPLDKTTQEDIDTLFSQLGATIWLDDETQVDGITALSGSGISYFFYLMQAMLQTGERYGFEKEALYDILSLTALGAATLAVEHENQSDFAKLIEHIAVKGGTTAAALTLLDKANIPKSIADAMDAVIERSAALRQNLSTDLKERK